MHAAPWQQHLINSVLTAFLIGAGAFLYSHFTTDPEHAVTQQTVKQHEETIELLTQSVAKQSISVTGLAIDRAVSALKEASKVKAQVEADNADSPPDEWTDIDRQLYLGALAQIKSAEERLGLTESEP